MADRKTAQQQLLELLQGAPSQYLSGKYLASALSVTTRTIRNYVRQLVGEGYTISSAKAGYKYEKGVIQRGFELNSDSLAILKILLYEKRVGISKVALAQRLHVSEATLDRRLTDLTDYLAERNTAITSHHGEVHLTGAEHDKRHLMYLLLNQESQQDILREFMLSEGKQLGLKKILLETAARHHLHIDSGTLNNILMHLTISIYRITRAHRIDNSVNEAIHQQLIKTGAMSVAREIAEQIKAQFAITMTPPEVDNLGLLLLDTLHYRQPTETQLKDLVAPRFYLLSLVLLRAVDNNYSLNLGGDASFISRFALHIQNLYLRLDTGNQDTPPVNKSIKKKFPFIYDIAVFICSQLTDIFEKHIPESEIDFIAMHIGTLLMTNSQPAAYDFYLVDKNYLDSNHMIREKLRTALDGVMTIVDTYQSYRDLPADVDYDRVIGTASPVPDTRILQISPFIDQHDVDILQKRIADIKDHANSDKLVHYIERFLPESLIFREQYFNGAQSCITWLCEQMNHQGYVSTTFKDDVLKREALSSTAFVKDIAVPHPLKPVTAHTTIAFVLNHKPMQWGDSYVRIIVLLGLSPNDHDEFQVIFDALIAALSNADTVQKLLDTQSYTEIIDILRDSVVYSG
ncbi:BglG family transcription antiterminator [Schleiferilactobacillus perolens]|uniref:Uncharacterized protein n=1 Tax=Schleiferilactobacillus perolens DSM 12744 TaxID=1423792 RepID=A0A0R1NCD0_9LACO|nr:PRD domain-containing protein [Schleiferilactobacillus perolens]KRL14627.1 hypothetical protein FD09_GL000280 [Schleiferilactobacillus perolens DSM 12744]